jgi:hypothetical protein
MKSFLSTLLLAGIVAGTAQAAPVVTKLASNVYQNLYGITADKYGVYVTGATGAIRDFGQNPLNGVIGFVPYTGGAVTTLYQNGNYPGGSTHIAPFQITTDGAGTLYWADPDDGPGTGASFNSGSTTGMNASQFFGICCGPDALPGDGIGVALASGSLYFSDGTGGRVGVGPSGSSATQIGPTRYAPDFSTEAWSQIAIAHGRIYFADSAQQRGADPATDKTDVQDQSASITPAVRWISIDGTSGFQTLTTKIPSPQGIVAVQNTLYVTSAHAVWTISLSNGKVKKLVEIPQFLDLQGITWFHGALYVADSQNVFPAAFTGGYKIAKKDYPGVIWKIVP